MLLDPIVFVHVNRYNPPARSGNEAEGRSIFSMTEGTQFRGDAAADPIVQFICPMPQSLFRRLQAGKVAAGRSEAQYIELALNALDRQEEEYQRDKLYDEIHPI